MRQKSYGGIPMGLIRRAMIVAILGSIFLGIAAMDALVSTELPQFKSGVSTELITPVNFNVNGDDYAIGLNAASSCGKILSYDWSKNQPPGYTLPQTVTCSLRYKNCGNGQTTFKATYIVTNMKTSKYYEVSKTQITPPGREDSFGYGKGNSLQIRLPANAPKGWYKAELWLRDTNRVLDIKSGGNQFIVK
jgi:hypothetical protein